MLRGQTGIRNLKRVEHTQVDQGRKIQQRTGRPDEPHQALIAKLGDDINQSFALQRLGITTVELQKIHRIRAQTLEARFQISPNDIGLPDVIEFQMVLPLRVSSTCKTSISTRTSLRTSTRNPSNGNRGVAG